MKCTQCPWELIVEINYQEEWQKLDDANYKRSRHVAEFSHIVRIKQETIYRIKQK